MDSSMVVGSGVPWMVALPTSTRNVMLPRLVAWVGPGGENE